MNPKEILTRLEATLEKLLNETNSGTAVNMQASATQNYVATARSEFENAERLTANRDFEGATKHHLLGQINGVHAVLALEALIDFISDETVKKSLVTGLDSIGESMNLASERLRNSI